MKKEETIPLPNLRKLFKRLKTVRLLSFFISFTVIFLCFLGLGAQNKAHAATYYVDNTITDTYPANATPDCTNYNTSTYACFGGAESAYKTIADVNAKSFSPDDQILFRKGQTWWEQLNVPSSGASGHPITFGAFGSGNKPIINGSDIITGWTNYSGNVWQATVTTEPKIVFFDNTRGIPETSIVNINAQYEWYWTGNVLYIYSTSDPDTAYTNPGIESGARDHGIYLSNKNYVTIDGFNIIGTNSQLIVNGGVNTGITIQNNTLSYNGANQGII